MNITKVSIYKLDSGNTLALASITLDNEFVVSGLKVLNGKNGLWVAFPNRKDSKGEYHDIAFPITKEARQGIITTVLDKYNEVVPFNDKDSEDIYNSVKPREEQKNAIDVKEEDLPF
jgi:stage V sporulation protein G